MTSAVAPAVMALWVLGMLVQVGLLIVLIGRRAHRQYPSFTMFIGFCVLRSTVLFYLAHHAPWLCTPVKWAAYVPQLVILVMLVLEVFHAVFHPYDTLPRGTLAHFLEAIAAVAVTAVVITVCYPGIQPTAWLTFARAMDQVTSWLLCAIFGFIALFSTYFGIPWRHRAYGIGLGFLFYLSVDVTVTTIVAHYGQAAFGAIWWLDMVAFMLACVIWAVYFGASETPRVPPSMQELQRIGRALGRVNPTVEKVDVQ